jgi:hypothetical protein
MQVRDEHVEALATDMSQGFGHAGGSDYVKSLAFQGRIHHGANRMIVIHQQDSMRNELSNRSHAPPPVVTIRDSVTEGYFLKCTKLHRFQIR